MAIKISIPSMGKPKLQPKPLAGIVPELVVKKDKPSQIEPNALIQVAIDVGKVEQKIIDYKAEDDIATIVASVKATPTPVDSAISANPLLDSAEAAMAPDASLEDKLTHIELLMEQNNIPVTDLKRCCDRIMKDIKASPDTVLDLEPEQIKLIVQGYIAASNEAVQEILNKKTKTKSKPKRPKVSSAAQELLEAAKNLNLDDVEF